MFDSKSLFDLNNGCYFAMPVTDTGCYITTLLWQIEERDKVINRLQMLLKMVYAQVSVQNRLLDGTGQTDIDDREGSSKTD